LIIIVLMQVNSVNLLHVPSNSSNSYGRILLDMLFTREEQGKSVVVPTKKRSNKPPLSPSRTQLLFGTLVVVFFKLLLL